MSYSAAVESLKQAIMAEEDRRVFEALDAAAAGRQHHNYKVLAKMGKGHGRRKRVLAECQQCFKRITMREAHFRRMKPEHCPFSHIVAVMES